MTNRSLPVLGLLAAVAALGCGDDDVVPPGVDGGVAPMDGGMRTDAGPTPAGDGAVPGVDAGPGTMTDAGPGTMTDAGPGTTTDAGPAFDAGPPAPEGCITSVAAGHHMFTCDELVYDVEVSASCAAGGCGLIFDVHGATMTATVEDRNTDLRALGSARGYIVVQPTAPPGTLGPSWDPARDDPKVLAFLELTMRAYRVNPDRVHFTGFSQGGYMTWRMLCAHAELFASVAPAAACTGTLFPACAFSATERPAVEVPVLYMHGRGDNIVAFSCGQGQRDAVVAGWSMTTDSVVSMDADHTWTRWRSAGGNTFEFIEHGYEAYSRILGGHCFPGSPDIGTSRFGTSGFGCDATTPFDWGETVIAFFEAHPRR